MCQSRNNSILVRHYECFGQLFSSYILNWSELEKAKLFCLVVKVFKLEQKVCTRNIIISTFSTCVENRSLLIKTVDQDRPIRITSF